MADQRKNAPLHRTVPIGELARRSGCSVATIRYYEAIGLLPHVARRCNGHRAFGANDLARLTLVRNLRGLGVALDKVRRLLTLTDERGRSCTEVFESAQSHLTEVRGKLKQLKALEKTLTELLAEARATCKGGPAPDCTVLRELSRSPATARDFFGSAGL
ncbi:MAG TPA: MerR family transcriptional regulator [Candidatus Binataceae bacterium]